MEMDADFVKTLVQEVKSQGVFDEFRMDSLADVDTKPAYQNVRNRVETSVQNFLGKQKWTPDTNKVQLREKLRKHLLDSDVLDKGVDHIVDQVVNPKVATLFQPKIESIAYKYLGITPPPPPANVPPPRPPLLPAPPLPPYAPHMNGGSLLKVETTVSLLPTDLEQISPDSDRTTVKSDLKDDSKEDDLPPGVDADDEHNFDDDTSPSFEPLSEEKPLDVQKEETNNVSLNLSDSINKELAHDSRDAGASQTSQLSQVSSDSRLTIASTESAVEEQQPTSNSVELTPNITANISEEAQMPKFNENSTDANGGDVPIRELHFDIKKDAITFEGTERRNSISEVAITSENGNRPQATSIEDAIMSELKANITEPEASKIERPLTPQPAECSFGSFSDAVQNSKDSLVAPAKQEEEIKVPLTVPIKEAATAKDSAAKTPADLKNDICVKEAMDTNKTDPNQPSDALKDETCKSAEFTASPASTSSHHKKHSRDSDRRHYSDDKQRRKSRERERDRSGDKTDKLHSKHSSNSSSKHSSHSSSSKHKSSRHDKSSTATSSRNAADHNTSSSKRSSSSTSSRHDSSSKKHKSSSSSARSESKSHSHGHSHSHSRSHNGSSSTSSKRSDRDKERDRERGHERNKSSSSSNTPAPIQDDHNELKLKVTKRKSYDSNDDSKPPGGSSSKSAIKAKDTAEAVNNSNEPNTNGKTNGTNGNQHDTVNADACDHDADASMTTNNVVVVSDMLQQSSTSFIELIGGAKPLSKSLEIKVPAMETDSVATLEKSTKDTLITDSEKLAEDTMKPSAEDIVISSPVVTESMPQHAAKDSVKQTLSESSEEAVVEAAQKSSKDANKTVTIPQTSEDIKEPTTEQYSVKPKLSTSPTLSASAEEPTSQTVETENKSGDDISSDAVTHFELNADEFKDRLEIICLQIEQYHSVVNTLSEKKVPTAFKARALRLSSFKRQLSYEQQEPTTSSDSTNSCENVDVNENPSKRMRRAVSKTSPTPSETSVNSKENELREKLENDDVSQRLSGSAISKLCQQQRYANDDLYKPRPVLSQRSRRRGLDSIL